MEKVIRKFDARKFRLAMIKIAVAACTVVTMCGTAMAAFATDAVGTVDAAPAGADTKALTTLVNVGFGVLRIFILAVGGIPGTIKVVQGAADENPRDRNAGIATLVITGAAIAATFVVKALII